MDYSTIKSVAFGYADRTDVETTDMYDSFLRVVESKVNRHLKTLQATSRVTLTSVDDQTYYGLPPDFNGMRNMQVIGQSLNGESRTVTAEFRTPAQINETQNTNQPSFGDAVYYTIIDDQLQIEPQLTNKTIELVYYRKVPALTPTVNTNWIGDDYPDAYVFGLLVEINSFNKDPESAAAWDTRFGGTLLEIKSNDVDVRWNSGTMLVTKTL